MAIACLRLVTFLPERPERNFPAFISRILRSTLRPALGPYFLRPAFFLRPLFLRAPEDLRLLDFRRPVDFLRADALRFGLREAATRDFLRLDDFPRSLDFLGIGFTVASCQAGGYR